MDWRLVPCGDGSQRGRACAVAHPTPGSSCLTPPSSLPPRWPSLPPLSSPTTHTLPAGRHQGHGQEEEGKAVWGGCLRGGAWVGGERPGGASLLAAHPAPAHLESRTPGLPAGAYHQHRLGGGADGQRRPGQLLGRQRRCVCWVAAAAVLPALAGRGRGRGKGDGCRASAACLPAARSRLRRARRTGGFLSCLPAPQA